MNHKSNIIHILLEFFRMLEMQFQVKIVQSNERDEFVNTILKHYFTSKGILHRLSCPGTP
jgi:hypothetical protein